MLMKLDFLNIFSKNTLIKFYENPSSGSRVVHADGRTDRHGQTDMKIIVTFRNFASSPNDMTVTTV